MPENIIEPGTMEDRGKQTALSNRTTVNFKHLHQRRAPRGRNKGQSLKPVSGVGERAERKPEGPKYDRIPQKSDSGERKTRGRRNRQKRISAL